MPEEGKNKGPLFSLNLGKPEGAPLSSTENLTSSLSTDVKQKVVNSQNPLFDMDIKAPEVKKKVQTQLESDPLQSASAGVTSELDASSLATSPKETTDSPINSQATVKPGEDFPTLTEGQVAISGIDFESLFDPKTQDSAPSPKIPSLEEFTMKSNQRSRKINNIENLLRSNFDTLNIRKKLLAGEETLDDTEAINDAVFEKVLNLTGDQKLAEQSMGAFSKVKNERDLILRESNEPLDVTPDFGSPQILNQIRKANADFNKQDLLASGKTEEEANEQSKILFPENEITKSIELGLNIDKVKNDYRSFLENNHPDRLKDINSAAAVGNFKGDRAMSFMKDALSHQAGIVDAKVNKLLAKGAENLSEEEIAQIEALEGQRGRLGSRFKDVILDYPELHKEAIKQKIAQQRVDDSYKEAKANALLPGYDGDKARAEVLYHQVVSPVLGQSVKMVGDVVQLGINQQRGMSDDEVTAGVGGIMGDWVTGFFDTEKSSSIYKKPSELKGGLYENGDLKAEKIVPKVSETLFQMYALLAGGSGVGSVAESAGMGANISQKLGLITSSYVMTQNDYFQEAKELGLSDNEANNFGNAAALLTSGLELINPQQHIFGKEGKKLFTEEVVKAVKGGVNLKDAIKQNANFVAKEIIGENAQEFAQEAGDLGVKYLFNQKNGSEDFDVSVTQDELKELITLTSIVAGGGSVHGVKSRNKLETESLFAASQDIDKFKEFLNTKETHEKFTEKELTDVVDKVTEYKKVVDGLPKNLDENAKIKLANLVYNKKKVKERKSEVFTDDVVAAKTGDDIQTQVDEINGQIEMVFEEQKQTNIDAPLKNVEVKTEGDVEYKIGDQFFSEGEIVEKLNNEEFVKSIKEGDSDLSISNPSPEVAQALETSGLLTKKEAKPMEEKAAVIKEQEGEVKEGETPAAKGANSEVVSSAKEETLVDKEGKIIADPVVPEEAVVVPQEKVDKLTELNFTEEAISKLDEAQIENIISEDIKFTEATDLKKVGKPIIGKAKIAEGFNELLDAIGGKANIAPNMFNKPTAFNALKKIAEGVVEETGLQGQKLVVELKKRLKEALGDKFQESDIDEVSEEIIEAAKSVKKTEDKGPEKDQKQPESRPEKKEVKTPEAKPVKAKKESVSPEKGPEKGEKQSGFQKRTLETAEGSPAKEQVKAVVEENKQFYKVMNISETVETASKNIEKEGGFDKAYERLITDSGIDPVLQIERQLALDFYGGQLDAAVKDGRKADADKSYKRANALQEAISRDATKSGQSIAMLQMWKALREDGTVEFMNRKIKDHNDSIKGGKASLNAKETIGETIDNFQEFVNDLTAEQINEILESPKGKSIVDKIVAKNRPNIKNDLEAKLKRRKAKVDSVVSRLDSLKIGGDKLFALPPGVNMLPAIWNGSIEVIKKSIQAGETMASAIEKAIVYIKSNVGTDDFGESAFRKQFASEKKSLDNDQEINLEIDKALEEIGLNIKDIIKKHYTEKDDLGRKLAEKLIEEAGIDKKEAESISKLIQEEFKGKIKTKAEEALTKALGITRLPVKKEVKKLANDLIEKINLGALDSDFYNGLFADKFGLATPLTPEQRVELKRLAAIVGKQESGSTFEAEATMDMLRFMDSLYPKKNVSNTFFSLFYASMLSGVTTSVLNLWSAGSNIGLKPIRDVLNLSKWIQAGRKGIESGSVKDFLAYAPFNDMFYMPAAISHAVSLGRKEFAEVWKNGDVDSKFIEQVANKDFSKLNPLERERYGKHAFKPINITVAGKKISINPFNYYKYSGRNLAAQDKLMFRVSKDIELVSIIREKQLDKGLRGSELRKAVIDEYTRRHIDKVAVQEKLDKEVAEFEKDTGKKITKRQKAIRLHQILESTLDPETVSTAEEVGRGNIFTDERGGLIATVAASMGRLSNLNPAMALILKPWIPFTRIVGNVSEYMMDTIPLYGQARAQGLGVTNLVKMYGGKGTKDINSSQMGLPGSREYYEQMGRAHLGTAVFIAALAMLAGTDEEDEVFITGGYAPDEYKGGRENVTPKYTLSIKGFEVPYLNIPGLAIPLSMIGNYNDRLNFGPKDESDGDRIFNAALATVGTFKDMSFLQGVQDLIEMINAVLSGEESETKRLKTDLYKKYFLTLTKPLPQNFNLIDQIEKLFDPTSWSQKDVEDLTMYGLGIQRFTNNPSLDLFGETVQSLPGRTLLPYDHWVGLKGNDERWKFLAKYNALQNRVSGNQDIIMSKLEDDGTWEDERRKPEKDELFEYTKKAGENFSEALKEYMSDGGFEEREKDLSIRGGKEISGVQKDISELWGTAKKEAREDLFLK